MSMADALRKINGKLPDWLKVVKPEEAEPVQHVSTVDDIADLVRMARFEGQIDRQSATWNTVTAWAATELLETFAKMETAEGVYATELRERARTLRDMLAMADKSREKVQFPDTAPFIA